MSVYSTDQNSRTLDARGRENAWVAVVAAFSAAPIAIEAQETSFTFAVKDAGKTYGVLLVNMGRINPGVNVSGMPGFPEITEAYAQKLKKQKQLKPDIYISQHAGQFDLHKKFKPGDPSDPGRLVDPDGYQFKIQFYEKMYLAQLQRDREKKQ